MVGPVGGRPHDALAGVRTWGVSSGRSEGLALRPVWDPGEAGGQVAAVALPKLRYLQTAVLPRERGREGKRGTSSKEEAETRQRPPSNAAGWAQC